MKHIVDNIYTSHAPHTSYNDDNYDTTYLQFYNLQLIIIRPGEEKRDHVQHIHTRIQSFDPSAWTHEKSSIKISIKII